MLSRFGFAWELTKISDDAGEGAPSKRLTAAEEMMRLQCQQEFNKFDADGSGSISSEELVFAMQAMHARVGLKEPTSEKVQKALIKFDKNNDGALDFDEFQDLFAH